MKLNSIDLNKIAVFCQVVDSGGYRRASEILNVTPSALSQTVTSLEHALGFALFHRRGRRLEPTEKGLQLQREFGRHYSDLLHSVTKLTQPEDRVTGLLRIGSYLEFAKSQLAPLLRDFLREHPQAQVKLVFETPSRLQQMLEQGRLDLCFSIFPSRKDSRIRSESIYHQELVLVTPPRWFGKNPGYQDILNTSILEYYFNHQPIRRWIELHYRKKPKDLPIRAYLSTAEMVLEMVRQGAGVGVVPKYLLDGDPSFRELEICRPTEKRCTDHLWWLEARSESTSALHRAFISHLRRKDWLL